VLEEEWQKAFKALPTFAQANIGTTRQIWRCDHCQDLLQLFISRIAADSVDKSKELAEAIMVFFDIPTADVESANRFQAVVSKFEVQSISCFKELMEFAMGKGLDSATDFCAEQQRRVEAALAHGKFAKFASRKCHSKTHSSAQFSA